MPSGDKVMTRQEGDYRKNRNNWEWCLGRPEFPLWIRERKHWPSVETRGGKIQQTLLEYNTKRGDSNVLTKFSIISVFMVSYW